MHHYDFGGNRLPVLSDTAGTIHGLYAMDSGSIESPDESIATDAGERIFYYTGSGELKTADMSDSPP